MKKVLTFILALAMAGSFAAQAQQETDIELISADETVEATLEESTTDKRVVEGTVVAVEEGQIELEDLVLNIDENTLVAGTDLVPTEVKEGDKIVAIANMAQTFSLPPQSYAHYVIVKESEEALAPIYMTVDRVENGFIYSEDGSYEVTFEEAQVEMYRTKNIVKAEELTEGSEIFVYADIMTMSIPALVNPAKIVIMSIAQEEISEEAPEEVKEEKTVESKALALHEQEILLGTDKGLELEREVTRAEAVALLHRTTMVPRMIYASSFDDVPQDHWAYSYISWASETGIVQGVGDNKFEPGRTVNAKELSMMLLNAMHIETEFENAFEKAVELKLITEEDKIEKDDVLTREAVANMIYNYINR